MKDITVRELLNKVNAQLKENIEKPIIPQGLSSFSRSYDTVNGMKAIDMADVIRMIKEITDEIFKDSEYRRSPYWNTEKFNIRLEGTTLLLKSRRKKTTMRTFNYTDAMVVYELYVENEEYLDKNISEFIEERMKALEQERNKEQKQIDDFKSKLSSFGLSEEDFLNLKSDYDKLPYSYKFDIRRIVMDV